MNIFNNDNLKTKIMSQFSKNLKLSSPLVGLVNILPHPAAAAQVL
jgi:hypothetical protein